MSDTLAWGREICGDLGAAERREWLCANGIGGFASGTVAGAPTRRGLLVAALQPPLGRTLLAAQVHETVAYDGQSLPLATGRWAFLLPLANHLGEYGVGSIAEIFDGEAPFRPGGCVAQAWSVAEVLRAWDVLGRAR